MYVLKFCTMRTNTLTEQAILMPAINALAKNTGASVKRVAMQPNDSFREIDDCIEIKSGKVKHTFYVEIKGELRQSAMERIIQQLQPQEQWLLVAQYIPGPSKDFLRKAGINYLEASGNCYINTGELVILINDQEVKAVRQTSPGKVWKAAGIQFLFVALQDPVMLVKSYWTIAHAAGICAGNIADIKKELLSQRYIDDTGQFIDSEILIEHWVEMYQTILKPKLIMGNFRFASEEQQQSWRRLPTVNLNWGGEPGGELYTLSLHPECFTLYTTQTGNEMVSQLKILPDRNGPITVLRKFWNDWEGDGHNAGAAPPLLVYADLRNSLDSRNWEIAKRVKKIVLR